MSIMEGNCLFGSPPPSADNCCANESNRSNMEATTLALENCEDILHRSDDSTIWTDEKHSLYLEHLEVSFVKQLHQSIGLHSERSNQDKRHKDTTQACPINIDITSEQFTTVPHGCREKTNYSSADPLSLVSPDSFKPVKIPWVYRSKRIGMHGPATSAHMAELTDAENKGGVVKSNCLYTCSQQCSTDGGYHDDPNYLMREGGGQNFVDEDYQTKSNTQSQAKRLKKG